MALMATLYFVSCKKEASIPQLTFTQTEWKALSKLNEDITTLEGKTKLGLKDIAEANGIQFYETKQFKDFLTSADHYINLLELNWMSLILFGICTNVAYLFLAWFILLRHDEQKHWQNKILGKIGRA